jgi:hypothetical protein
MQRQEQYGFRRTAEAALYAAPEGWLMSEELAVGVWTKKSEDGR